MDYYATGKLDVQPGAKERIEKKLKDLPKINQERPCKKCANYNQWQIVRCNYRKCDFYHSGFEPITETK